VKTNKTQKLRALRLVRWAACGLLLVAVTAQTAQAGPEDRRERQISVFERALDDMLVESPNWLVRNGEPTYGYYVDDHGAVFSFRASLVSRHNNWGESWWKFWGDDDDDEDYDRNSRSYDREVERQARRYESGKEEIIETILDFGEVLGSMSDTDVLEISVKLRSAPYFRENDLRKLEMKVKMSDLRAYYDGRMSEEAITSAVEVTED